MSKSFKTGVLIVCAFLGSGLSSLALLEEFEGLPEGSLSLEWFDIDDTHSDQQKELWQVNLDKGRSESQGMSLALSAEKSYSLTSQRKETGQGFEFCTDFQIGISGERPTDANTRVFGIRLSESPYSLWGAKQPTLVFVRRDGGTKFGLVINTKLVGWSDNSVIGLPNKLPKDSALSNWFSLRIIFYDNDNDTWTLTCSILESTGAEVLSETLIMDIPSGSRTYYPTIFVDGGSVPLIDGALTELHADNIAFNP